jgi:hypothetical protein
MLRPKPERIKTPRRIRYMLITVGIVGLASCGVSPASLGITGPGLPPTQANEMGDSTIVAPGIVNTSPSGYRYNIGPRDRYFDYN